MTERVQIRLNAGGVAEFEVEVAPGDRVDSLGNVWSMNGIWKSGPGLRQAPIAPTEEWLALWTKCDGELLGVSDPDDELPEWMRAEPPKWLPKDVFDALVNSVAAKLSERREKFEVEGEITAIFDDPSIVEAMRAREAEAEADLPDYIRDGLRALGWCLWPAKILGEFLWTRPPGPRGPYAVEHSPAWYADIEEIKASRCSVQPESIDDDFISLSNEQVDGMIATGWLFDEDHDGVGRWIKGSGRGGDHLWLADLLVVNGIIEAVS